MKNRLMIIVIGLCVSLSCQVARADSCPAVDSFDPYDPPGGWTLSMPPVIPGESYHFTHAVHFLDTALYPRQILCVYATCEASFCPSFSILSLNTYRMPNRKVAPWDDFSRIKGSLTCTPEDHDPGVCVFQ